MLGRLLYLPIGILSSVPSILLVQFRDTINLGTIILGLLLSIATLAGIIYGVRWKVAYEVEASTREAAQNLAVIKDLESKDLHGKLLESLNELSEAKQIIERLEQLPNLATLIELINKQYARSDQESKERVEIAMRAIQDFIDTHDTRAENRAERIIAAIKENYKAIKGGQ